MAFGGFFGGGSNNDDSSSSSSSSDSSSSTSSNPFGNLPSTTLSSSSSSNESSRIRNQLQTAITTQANIVNAKYLIQKVTENCFDHCVPAPGASLSSREQTCLSTCMEKYIEAWNVTNRTYIRRLQREGANLSGVTGAGGAAGGGKEMF